jgi:catechol 2,3-dioxygenase-like lactoylglutathione lyase family enzyme
VIGRMHHVVIDCPDPAMLAAFYSELLGLRITHRSDAWVVIARNDTTSGVAFQRAPDSSRWVPDHCAAVTTSTPTLPDTRSASSPARRGHHRFLTQAINQGWPPRSQLPDR